MPILNSLLEIDESVLKDLFKADVKPENVSTVTMATGT